MEALIVVLMLGIVGTVLYRTLTSGQRVHGAHAQDAALSESLRAALVILSRAFRELSAGDGDLLAMDSSSFTFRSMGALYLQCAAPDTAAGVVLLHHRAVFGAAPAAVPDDSMLLFVEGDPLSRRDDRWVSAAAVSAAGGTACPGGSPSLGLTVTGVDPVELAAMQEGGPVRAFHPATVLVYQDARRDWWLGQRDFQVASGSWSTVQPVLGPLTAGGLTLEYADSAGEPTSAARTVSRVAIRVTARSPERVHRTTGSTYLVRSAAAVVGLRNNPRY